MAIVNDQRSRRAARLSADLNLIHARVTINTQPVELAAVETRLRDIFASRHDRTLWVRGDGSLRYGDIVKVIDAARGAGVTRVGVVTPGALAGR